jgi:hypothetical protein
MASLSFRAILLKFEGVFSKVLGAVVIAEPEVQAILPVFGPLAAAVGNTVFGAVNSVETLITGVQQGQAKQQSALAILQAQIPNLQAVVNVIGKDAKLSPTALNAISPIVDAGVTFANALLNFQSAITPDVATPPVPAA